ncbi:unnamed protein product [Clonostachys solani]|uniref:Uncharacterized protein n=1 Tax=Clonostachys solani TaxID=160281 RepID=A0A9P0ESY5_9HYPO|nr:unnamed protein product [Clonostachys solani]
MWRLTLATSPAINDVNRFGRSAQWYTSSIAIVSCWPRSGTDLVVVKLDRNIQWPSVRNLLGIRHGRWQEGSASDKGVSSKKR